MGGSGGFGFGFNGNQLGSALGYVADPGDLFGRRAGASAAQQQLDAQKTALEQQKQEAENTRGILGGLTDQGRQDIIGYNQQAGSSLADMYGQAQGYLGQGQSALGGAYGTSLAQLGQGYDQARGDMGALQGLQQYGQGATTAINPYQVTGQGSMLADRMSQGDALASRIGAPVDMQSDPGFQFRQQQGEQSLLHSQAARGGRLAPAALKELMNYNSGLASQEYGNAFNRQQSQNAQQMQLLGQQYGAAGNVDAMNQQALLNQAGRSDAAQLAAQGNQMGLASMGYGAQNTLANMAAQQGQQSAGLSSDYGKGLASMYGNQAEMAQGQGGAMSSLLSNTGSNLGNLTQQMGGNYTSLANGMMGAYQNYAQYPGMVQQQQANSGNQLLGAGVSIVAAL